MTRWIGHAVHAWLARTSAGQQVEAHFLACPLIPLDISMMKLLTLLLAAPATAFTTTPLLSRWHNLQTNFFLSSTTIEEVDTSPDGGGSPVPKGPDDVIPTNLPSACGKDYIPLANMLATGELVQADQVRSCRPTESF